MKFTISQSELQKAIKVVIPAIRESVVVPICETIKFVVSDDNVQLIATNLQVELSVKTVGKFDEAGQFCLPAIKLKNLVENLPDQPLNIEVIGSIATIKSATGKYEFPVSSAKDFPEFKVEPDKSIEIEAEIFQKGIKRTVFACYIGDDKPQQTGVFIEIGKEAILFTSTDSHRVNHIEFSIEADLEASIIVPASSLKLLPELTGKLQVAFSANNISIETENISFKSSLIDAIFPPYRLVIPTNDKLLTIGRLQLLQAVNRVAGFASSKTNLLKLELGQKLVISGHNVEYSEYGEEIIDSDYQAEEMQIGCSAEYLAESLQAIEQEEIFILFSDPKKGILIKEDLTDSNYIMCMPMFLES